MSDRLPRKLLDIERRLRSLEFGPQLGYSSIEDGSIPEYDGNGDLVSIIGKQPDGSHTYRVVKAPLPLQPTDPQCVPDAGTITVTWDGNLIGPTGTVDAELPLYATDEACEIHVGDTESFLHSPSTFVGELPRSGGSLTVGALAGQRWVRLVMRSQDGRHGPPSPAVPVTVLELVDPEQFDQLAIDLFEAEQRLAEAKGRLDDLDQTTLPQLADNLDAAKGRLDAAFGLDHVFDVSDFVAGETSAAQQAAEAYALAQAEAAETAAKGHADVQAGAAETAAKGYADTKVAPINTTIATAFPTGAFNVNSTISAAQSAAQAYAESQASAAETAAKSHADTVVSPIADDLQTAFPTGPFVVDTRITSQASAAETAAKSHADTKASAAQTAAQGYADTKVAPINTAISTAFPSGAFNVTNTISAARTAAEQYAASQASAAETAAKGHADTVVAPVATKVNTAFPTTAFNVDTRITTKAGEAESAAKSHADTKASAAQAAAIAAAAADAQAKADAAKTAAEQAAADHAAGLITDAEVVILEEAATAAQAKADAAKDAAIAAAATDATTKASNAQSAAQTFATNAVAPVSTKLNTAFPSAAFNVDTRITTKAGEAETAAKSHADTKASAAQTAAQGYADTKVAPINTSLSTAFPTGAFAVDTRITTKAGEAETAAKSHADTKASQAETAAKGYADTQVAPVATKVNTAFPTTAFNVATSITTAETAAKSHADTKASQAQTAAISAAATDAATKATAAKNDAISAASADATSKAATAESNAKAASVGKVSGPAGAKVYRDVLSWHESGQTLDGWIVITTPITFGNYMNTIHLLGYNYLTGESEIDLQVGFYAYSASGGSVLNYGVTNRGNVRVETFIARDDNGKAVIGLRRLSRATGAVASWSYPKITVAEALIGQSTAPDAWVQGWSATRILDGSLPAYPHRRDVTPVDAVVAAATADSKAVTAQSAASAADTKATNAATAAATADGKAVAAQNTANQAVTAAGAAQTKADAAMLSADGKNAISYSNILTANKPGPAPAPSLGAGRRQFDVHRNRDSSTGEIYGEWYWTGSAWSPINFGDAILRSLDVGKITGGSAAFHDFVANNIVGNVATLIQLDAGKITTGQLAAARIDVANLAVAMAQVIYLDASHINAGYISVDRLHAQTVAGHVGQFVSILANQITGGTITSTVTVSGKIQTASSGARVEITSAGLRRFDSTGQVILDATGNAVTMIGELRAWGASGSGVTIKPNSDASLLAKGSIEFPAPTVTSPARMSLETDGARLMLEGPSLPGSGSSARHSWIGLGASPGSGPGTSRGVVWISAGSAPGSEINLYAADGIILSTGSAGKVKLDSTNLHDRDDNRVYGQDRNANPATWFTPASGISITEGTAVREGNIVTIHLRLAGVGVVTNGNVSLGTLTASLRPGFYFCPWIGWPGSGGGCGGLISSGGAVSLRWSTSSSSSTTVLISASYPV